MLILRLDLSQSDFESLEFGTLPLSEVLDALRGDHWLHVHPEADENQRALIKDAVKAAEELKNTCGVVDHGLFCSMAAEAIVADVVARSRIPLHKSYSACASDCAAPTARSLPIASERNASVTGKGCGMLPHRWRSGPLRTL